MSASILSEVLQCNKDIQKRKGYVANLKTEIFENDLYYTINSIRISDFGLLNNYWYIDINNTQEYLTTKSVFIFKKISNNNNINIPILVYKNSRHVVFFIIKRIQNIL